MKVITEELLKKSFQDKFDYILSHKEILESSSLVFVYNSIEKHSAGDLHISECVYDDEIALIKDSFTSFPKLKFIAFDDEELFIKSAPLLKQSYKNVFVYSMAQNLTGTGRRCLIPLLCEYYGFINISSNSRSSFFGGDKQLMFTLLDKLIEMPKRIILESLDKEQIRRFRQDVFGDLLLKPNSESASIGISKLEKNLSETDAFSKIEKAIDSYGKIILEEFIAGDEVECTVLRWGNDLYVCEPVEIIKDTEFLDYKTVASDNYGFRIYQGDSAEYIKAQAFNAYKALKFDSIARFDFISKDGNTHLFDITPNPTISSCSSANTAMHLIKNDDRTIYIALLLQKLLIPTLDQAE